MAAPLEAAVVMDWGGTWARAGVVDRSGRLLWQTRQANPPQVGQAALLELGLGLLREAIAWCAGRTIAGVGIAVAGPVDAATGALDGAPHLRGLNGVSLSAVWGPELGLPIRVGNDANLAALGEYHHGAGALGPDRRTPPDSLFYMTVSTGIGGGLVHRGRLYLGAHGLSAEVGHTVIDWRADAAPCFCGSRGCLEALASGTAVARAARQRRAGPQWRGRSTLAGMGDQAITSKTVFDAAKLGDPLALDLVDEAVQALAAGLASVLHLLDPDLLVLGGGVTQGLMALDRLPQLAALVHGRSMNRRYRECPLVPARLGDAAGLVGAACLVWQG